MIVADIGAGSGYYVVRLSPIVGANGRIIAILELFASSNNFFENLHYWQIRILPVEAFGLHLVGNFFKPMGFKKSVALFSMIITAKPGTNVFRIRHLKTHILVASNFGNVDRDLRMASCCRKERDKDYYVNCTHDRAVHVGLHQSVRMTVYRWLHGLKVPASSRRASASSNGVIKYSKI